MTAAEKALAVDLLPRDEPTAATWSVALMELGALVCTAAAPRCDDVPGTRRVRLARRRPPGVRRPTAARPGLVGHRPPVPWPADGARPGRRGPGRRAERWSAPGRTADQRGRCLESLLADGLLVRAGAGYALAGCDRTPAGDDRVGEVAGPSAACWASESRGSSSWSPMNVASTRTVAWRAAAVADRPTRRSGRPPPRPTAALVSRTAVAYGSRPNRPSAAASTYNRWHRSCGPVRRPRATGRAPRTAGRATAAARAGCDRAARSWCAGWSRPGRPCRRSGRAASGRWCPSASASGRRLSPIRPCSRA